MIVIIVIIIFNVFGIIINVETLENVMIIMVHLIKNVNLSINYALLMITKNVEKLDYAMIIQNKHNVF